MEMICDEALRFRVMRFSLGLGDSSNKLCGDSWSQELEMIFTIAALLNHLDELLLQVCML